MSSIDLVFSFNHPTKTCGITDFSKILVESFNKNGYQFQLITSSNCQKSFLEEEKTLVFGDKFNFNGIKSILDIISKNKTKHIIFQFTPGLYINNNHPFGFFLLLIIIKFYKIKITIHFHELSKKKTKFLNFNNFKRLWIKMNIKLYCRMINHIVTSTNFYKKFLPLETIVISTPSNFEPYYNKKIIKSNYEKSCYYIGCFRPKEEAINILVDILQKLLKKMKKIKIMVIGDLNYLNGNMALFEPFKEFIEVTGKLNQDEILKTFSKLDVFIALDGIEYYSKYTGTNTKSGSTATSFMMGIPVVGIQGELNASEMIHEKNILLSPHDSSAVVNSLFNLRNNSSLNKRLSTNGQIFYRDYLCWNITLDKYSKLLEN